MRTIASKKETYSYWRKQADDWFSLYIRAKYADENKKIHCSCGCGAYMFWKNMHASHYEKRGDYATRYNENNVVPASPYCNKFDQHHKENIGRFINANFHIHPDQEVVGWAMTDLLIQESKTTAKFTRYELKEIAEKYKALFNEIKKAKKL